MSGYETFLFAIEVTISGLLAGVMYALVGLGFVLIFKASSIFNFAQGAMVLFAALGFVSFLEQGIPLWGAFLITLVMMIGLAIAIERIVLRPLVAQPPITLFMATIGLAFFLEGLAQGIWGSQVHGLDIGVPDVPFEIKGIFVSQFELFAAGIAALLVIALVWFFQKTRIGRALRAVSDDHEAALSVGIPLRTIWGITWGIAGLVALVAGILWGTRLGVQYSLSLIVLKALPVIILGGLDSITGAIVGGLIIGAGEKLAEVFLGPYVGGGIENFFPYLLAMIFLAFRPYGLFGNEIIERV
ncbi:MAG: branched-chain amino acid ABC transporter permease [Nitrospinota bacterium]|nr:MAG: branched-chain amino acid ABC transporter permease [Nitrospinota bacterium]